MKQRKSEDCTVNQISPESGKGRDRVVHRNLLLPCDFLLIEAPAVMTTQPRADSEKAKRKSQPQHRQQQQAEQDDSG